MAGCDDNVEIASNIVLQSQASYTRRRRNIDTRELVVQHNNKVGIQVRCFNFHCFLFTVRG